MHPSSNEISKLRQRLKRSAFSLACDIFGNNEEWQRAQIRKKLSRIYGAANKTYFLKCLRAYLDAFEDGSLKHEYYDRFSKLATSG